MKTRGYGTFLKLVVVFLLIEGYDGGKPFHNADDYYCIIPTNGGSAKPKTLCLCPYNGQNNFLYPIKPGVPHFVVLVGKSGRVACPGSRSDINRVDSHVKITPSVGAKRPFVDNDEEPIDAVAGDKYPKFLARSTGDNCGQGLVFEIGFFVNAPASTTKGTEFTQVMEVCHNADLGHTIYAHAKILPGTNTAQQSFARIAFTKGNFFQAIPMHKVYTRKAQRDTMGQILNSQRLALTYLPEKGTFFFAKGHLIAKADFADESYQRATFIYANAVPMWQNINGGNWKIMESNVRSLAAKRNLDLDVWVGSIGILTLKDERAREQEIYLYVDNDKHAVPVPKILFKVVYSKAEKSGVVFLTANNPHLKHLTDDFRVCPDVCNEIDYLTWKPSVATQGLSYCCSVEDFRKAFPNIPNFKTDKLLL